MIPRSDSVHVLLFFTWDVSLKIWQDKGLLQREVRYYEQLADQGVQVTFVTWGDESDLEVAKTLHDNISVVPVYKYNRRFKSNIVRVLMSPFAVRSLRSHVKDVDVIKTNQMHGGWCAVLAKRIYKVPMIVRTGFELYQFALKRQRGLFYRTFVKLVSRLTYKAGDLIYLATQEDRDFVCSTFGVDEKIISVRPNWIDIDVFKPLKVTEKSKTILFVGRLSTQKNIPLLFDAMKGTEWTVDLVGEGELQGELEALAQKTGVKANFLGLVANDKLSEVYNSYPVYVLCSDFEGNPKTLLEAMACGRAVIGTKVEGIESVIDDGVTGVLCKQDKQELKDKIRTLIDDDALRQRLGAAAREQILNTQTLDKLIDKELTDYYALTSKS